MGSIHLLFRHMAAAGLLITLSVIPTETAGMTFTAELLDAVGPFPSRSEPGRVASFDFEQDFVEIHGLWIEVEARVTAEQFDVCGRSFDPQPCVHFIQLLGFYAVIDEEALGRVSSDGLFFADPGDFRPVEGSGTAIAPFNNRIVGWDFLLDGKGSLTLFWNNALGDPDRVIRNVIEPTGEIFGGRLILEATPVPEPSTATLVLLGLTIATASGCLRTSARSSTRPEIFR